MNSVSFDPKTLELIVLGKTYQCAKEELDENGVTSSFLLEDMDDEHFEELLTQPDKIPDGLKIYRYASFLPGEENFLSVTKNCSGVHVVVSFDYMWHEWDHSVPFLRYLDDFSNVLAAENPTWNITPHFEHNDNEIWIEVSCFVPKDISPSAYLEEINCIARTADKKLRAKLRYASASESFLVHFQIPEQFRGAAEQYLSFFAEFLVGVGLDSESSVRRMGTETILEVVPKSGHEALLKIQDALQVYLFLPEQSVGVTAFEGIESQVRTQQLLSVVEHLKSQLRLSQALVEVQKMQIGILNSPSPENVFGKNVVLSGKQPDELSLFNNTVRVHEYKGKFFTVNLPRIYMKLLKYLRRT